MNIRNKVIQEIKQNNNSLNIAIAGCTCSGKTTLANTLKENLEEYYSVSVIHQDDYYKNLDKIPRSKNGYLTDSINAFEIYEFKQDIKSLLTNGYILIPRYDVSQNIRITKDIRISKSQVNIFEGLHVIKLLENLNNILTIFLDTSMNVCLERRINRDVTLYNISEARIREYFNNCIIPLSECYVLPQKNNANIVLDEKEWVKCLSKR